MQRRESMPPAAELRGRSVIYVTSVAFTRRAKQLSEKVRRAWNDVSSERREVIVWKQAGKLTDSLFHTSDVLLFFCASGIAVRLAAPFLRDKTSDPAVLVIDEEGKFVISLLSGHLGGANRYAHFIAEMLDAQPVITTATDGRKMAALDVWSEKCGLAIDDMKLAKRITAHLLAREDMPSGDGGPEQPIDEPVSDDKIRNKSDFEKSRHVSADDKNRKKTEIRPDAQRTYHICIAEKAAWRRVRENAPHNGEILFLEPKKYVIGIGCRKGTEYEKMAEFLREFLAENGIDQRLISRICSIDLKAEEECIKRTARWLGAEFSVFSKDDLLSVIGDFSASDFVKRTVGVDNVCERSALLGASEDARNLDGFHRLNYLRNLSGLQSSRGMDGEENAVFFEDGRDFDRIRMDGRDKIDILCDGARAASMETRAELIVKKTVGQGMTAAAAAVCFTCREPILFTAEEWLKAVQQNS